MRIEDLIFCIDDRVFLTEYLLMCIGFPGNSSSNVIDVEWISGLVYLMQLE